jgi:hypothetical protein
MYKVKFFCLILITAVHCSNNLGAQEKYEKESRIREKYVPTKALQFIDSSDLKSRIRWYLEEGLNRKSIEAKFKHDKVRYSVEFDTLGNVEDIEIETPWENLNSHLKDSISSHLKKDCLKHKIVKVQIQYSGSESELLAKLKTNHNSQYLKIKYEIVVKCNLHNKVELFEYLFNEAGTPLSVSKILFKNSSHLEY